MCVFFSAASLPPDDDAHTDGGHTIKGMQLCIKLRKIDLPSEITLCPQFFYPNFFKIKLLLVFHETLCYLIDSFNLHVKNPYLVQPKNGSFTDI